jgi:hypothetical protein
MVRNYGLGANAHWGKVRKTVVSHIPERESKKLASEFDTCIK